MNAFTSENPLAARKRLNLALLCLCALLPLVSHATDALWENSGTIIFPPQIDATNFVNTGFIVLNSTLPFETANTRNYTNSGTIIASPGFLFDDAAANAGNRQPADNFFNSAGASVQSLDTSGLTFVFIGPVFAGAGSAASSYLWVDASNVVNKGTLSVGGGGWLKLRGTNVNVARSALEVTALVPTGGFVGQTNYLNDVGISDVWWGQTNGLTFNSANIYTGSAANAPTHPVQVGPGGFQQGVRFSVPNPLPFGYSNTTQSSTLTLTNKDGSTTNVDFPTNIIKQAVFVGISDPSVTSVDVRFFPSSTFTNPFQTVCVKIAVQSTNVITQAPDATTLFFYDTLASETNRGLNVNLASPGVFPFVDQRPANYILARLDFRGMFAAGTPGNITPDPLYLFDPTTFGPTNRIVTGEYAGYNAFVDNLVTEPPPTTASTVTNFPGRVQVLADSLDFRNTRVRGEGEVMVHANHLLSSEGAAVDCENLSYTLGSTNGLLRVQNLAKQSVIRMKGNLVAWSGLWSNQMTIVITNNFAVTNTVDTNGVVTGTNAVPAPITNTINLQLHALILDGDGLIVHRPVITWDLIMHSTNIVVDDLLSVVQNLLLDGQSFTLNGKLALTSTTLQNTRGQSVTFSLDNWISTNAPDILFFTNNGTLTMPGEAHFGDDRAVPYSDFVNAGTLSGGSVDVVSSYIENDGIISASVGPLHLVGDLGLFQTGQTASSGELDFFFNSLKFSSEQLTSAGALNLTVTNGLSDAGPTFSNTFRMQNGFNLLIKPNNGDLLGTTFQDAAPNFVEVDHTWAGADRGATNSGYSDNTAIGQLILSVQNINPQQAPLFFFKGANGHNGLYVDLLDLTSLGSNYLNYIEIDPSLTIYYAAAKLSFTPPTNPAGIPQEPEEFLNGQFGGRLQWVSSFAGPNSSVDVVINGVTVSVNRALRFSKIIDSNGNGIPNFFDPFPFDTNPLVLSAVVVKTNMPPSGGLGVSWNAAPQKVYQVEFSSDVRHQGWQLLTRYTNTTSSKSVVTIWDTNAPAGARRFYRVKTTP